MPLSLARMLVAILAATGVAACSEKPQRAVPKGEQAYNRENSQSPLRDRTLKQGESGRTSY